jgi:hypothetical protein
MRFAAVCAALASASTPAVAAPKHAPGLASDFKVYQEQFWAGAYEKLDQNTNLFGAASAGTFELTTQSRKGDFVQESVIKLLTGLVSRRDTTSNAAATDAKLTQDERVTVKLNRKIGPIAETYDALRKIASSWEEVSDDPRPDGRRPDHAGVREHVDRRDLGRHRRHRRERDRHDRRDDRPQQPRGRDGEARRQRLEHLLLRDALEGLLRPDEAVDRRQDLQRRERHDLRRAPSPRSAARSS